MINIYEIARWISKNTNHNDSIKIINEGYIYEKERIYINDFIELKIKNKIKKFQNIKCDKEFYSTNVYNNISYILFRFFGISLIKTKTHCYKIKKLDNNIINQISLISKNFKILVMLPIDVNYFKIKVEVPLREHDVIMYQRYIKHKLIRLLNIHDDYVKLCNIFNSAYIELIIKVIK